MVAKNDDKPKARPHGCWRFFRGAGLIVLAGCGVLTILSWVGGFASTPPPPETLTAVAVAAGETATVVALTPTDTPTATALPTATPTATMTLPPSATPAPTATPSAEDVVRGIANPIFGRDQIAEVIVNAEGVSVFWDLGSFGYKHQIETYPARLACDVRAAGFTEGLVTAVGMAELVDRTTGQTRDEMVFQAILPPSLTSRWDCANVYGIDLELAIGTDAAARWYVHPALAAEIQ